MKNTVPVKPKHIHNNLYKIAGGIILILNKLRRDCIGYTSPRTFSMTDYEKAADYDVSVVENWLSYLSAYSEGKAQVKGKSVLELGPGADLGVGLYLLFKGIAKYNALDINNLAKHVPHSFYDSFFEYLRRVDPSSAQCIDILKYQLELTCSGKNDLLNYNVCKNFNLSVFERKSIDLIFSQAAFEHFDNVDETIRQLSEVSKNGAILIAVVDLKTHSQWIRDHDPLNIYRYSKSFYERCRFRGSPNLMRPFQYMQILQKYGWRNVRITPKKVLDKTYLKEVWKSLDARFLDHQNEMDMLSIVLCATKQ